MPLPALPPKVTVVEVGPRDGLQNEARPVATGEKVAFVDRLSAAGLPVIEVTAFVNPQRVPQMADAADVLRNIGRRAGTRYTALVPNLKGLERALSGGVDAIAVFAAASETFSQRNVNQSVDASLDTYREVARRAIDARVQVRGYLSTCFGCPFEGPVPATRVADLAARLLDLGSYEIVLSDTIGMAHPALIAEVVDAAARVVPIDRLALHLHDTRGTALANVLTGLQSGVTTFDASAGGLGGCPFAPGATGNLATEDLIYMLDGLGIATGVSLDAVVGASAGIEAAVGHALPSRYYRATRAAVERRG